jgi:hypothetical protein
MRSQLIRPRSSPARAIAASVVAPVAVLVTIALSLAAAVLPAWHAAQHAAAHHAHLAHHAPATIAQPAPASLESHGHCDHACWPSPDAPATAPASPEPTAPDQHDCPTCAVLLLARAHTALIAPPAIALAPTPGTLTEPVANALSASREVIVSRARAPPIA